MNNINDATLTFILSLPCLLLRVLEISVSGRVAYVPNYIIRERKGTKNRTLTRKYCLKEEEKKL